MKKEISSVEQLYATVLQNFYIKNALIARILASCVALKGRLYVRITPKKKKDAATGTETENFAMKNLVQAGNARGAIGMF